MSIWQSWQVIAIDIGINCLVTIDKWHVCLAWHACRHMTCMPPHDMHAATWHACRHMTCMPPHGMGEVQLMARCQPELSWEAGLKDVAARCCRRQCSNTWLWKLLR